MPSRIRQMVAPLYLFACLILGGSAQGVWQIMLLQLSGVAILAWAAFSDEQEPLLRPARQLLLIAVLGIAVVALQLIPLPASLSPHLGGRAQIARDYAALGLPIPSLPVSLTPYGSLDCLLALIPPLAMLCAVVRLKAYRLSWLAAALVGGALAGIMLGAVQVASSQGGGSAWYLYPETNFGLAVGFFANANHMATLLVITFPFLAAVAAMPKSDNLQRYSALVALVAGLGLVVLVGLALNGSLAGYGLALPVVAASALIVLPPGGRARIWLAVLSGLLLITAIGVLATTSIGSARVGQEAATSVQSREDILATTGKAIGEFMPLGSGLGSFESVYHLYERPEHVDPTYVIHAHNDYAELALETGLPGILVMFLFLAWWVAAVWRLWRNPEAGPFARAASIASGAILAHSIVDFPLRTAAIAASFAMCLALLADRRAPQVKEASDFREARHMVLR